MFSAQSLSFQQKEFSGLYEYPVLSRGTSVVQAEEVIVVTWFVSYLLMITYFRNHLLVIFILQEKG